MKKLTMMRGLPGSGKSFVASMLGGVVYSTDDFFMRDGQYVFDGKQLSQAHARNQLRAEIAMWDGVGHLVIDNTNTQAWECQPYVRVACDRGYEVEFVEPQTPWAWDAEECARRNEHGVPLPVIQAMLSRYEKSLTVGMCLAARRPWRR